ncbi:MAG: hypothetical protein IT514_05135 [Burkholderiales bacterium]|nr:hypothetical protein [Burkholderiales bacterium]
MSLFGMFGAEKAAEGEGDRAVQGSPGGEKHEPPRFDPIPVLEKAGVTTEQRDRVERTLELLKALPAESPAEVRKGIVEASLKAFDISIGAIVEAANAQLAAFRSFIATGHKQLDDQTRKSNERIAHLQAEIAKLQRQMEMATSDQATLDQAAIAASERVRPVLAFFGEAMPRVEHAARDSPAASMNR